MPLSVATPRSRYSFAQARPDAPAPENTTLVSSIFLPVIFSALSSAAAEMIAVPC